MMESGLIGPLGPQKWIGIRMTDSPRNPGNPSEPSDVGAVPNVGRRRLLQAGVSTAPVLMTVLSRPVLAQPGNCQSPSGFVSGNASNPGMETCSGRTPLYWSGLTASQWPGTYTPTTLFTSVFAPALNGNATLTFLQVLNTTGGPGNFIARLCVAAVLNVAAGPTFIPPTVLTKATIVHIWHEYATTLHYSPVPLASWSDTEIIDYLTRIMPGST